MTGHIETPDDFQIKTPQDVANEFAKSVLTGFSKPQKQLESKYFYDAKGAELFNQITRHPDYYLTNTEVGILKQARQEISYFLKPEPFNLVELGPGEGLKTNLLIEQFLTDQLTFSYTPIDISSAFLKKIINDFNTKLPNLEVLAINSDYLTGLEWLSLTSARRNVVLFFGSSIGNLDTDTTHHFLNRLWQTLHPGDYVLIGFDLRKPVDILYRAYNDRDGLTQAFNLNLLTRINREMGGHFDLAKFMHYETYNVYTGAMESYLLSLEKQSILIESLKKAFLFQAFEPIHTEYSFKYTMGQIQAFAANNGFSMVRAFKDPQHYFLDAWWRVVK